MDKNYVNADTVQMQPKDPVCGMQATDEITSFYGRVYAFCSDHCRQQFEKDPEAYIPK